MGAHAHQSYVQTPTHRNCGQRKGKAKVKPRSRKKSIKMLVPHYSNWLIFITSLCKFTFFFFEGRIYVSHIKSFYRMQRVNAGKIQ